MNQALDLTHAKLLFLKLCKYQKLNRAFTKIYYYRNKMKRKMQNKYNGITLKAYIHYTMQTSQLVHSHKY